MEPLTFIDYEVLNLRLLDGLSIRQISRRTGLTTQYIRKLLNREEVKRLTQEAQREVAGQLKNLVGLATEKLRECLLSSNKNVVLLAVEKVYRTQGMFKDVVEGRLTAEDVVKELLKDQRERTVGEAKRQMVEKHNVRNMDVFDQSDNKTFH